MKIFLPLFFISFSGFLYAQETINNKHVNYPMDERLIDKKTLLDSITDERLLSVFDKIPFYKASYIEKDFGYASQDHFFFQVDSLAINFPELVDYKSGFIPSIYSTPQKVSYNRKSNLLDFTMEEKHNLQKGDVIMLEIKDGRKFEFNVEDIPNDFTFSLKNHNIPKSNTYFIRGKKVDNLSHIDRDELILYIIRINQILNRKIIELDSKIKKIEEQKVSKDKKKKGKF